MERGPIDNLMRRRADEGFGGGDGGLGGVCEE